MMIESYDTTTVRASVGNYLIAKYISENSQPKEFFESLKHADDRFSWIEDDYRELENTLQGS